MLEFSPEIPAVLLPGSRVSLTRLGAGLRIADMTM
jgi:hypothetical protein